MTYFLFCLGLLQVALLWAVGHAGQIQLVRAREEKRNIDESGIDWPSCALIIPIYGDNQLIETAIRSLLLQNYPDYTVYLVTARASDPASALIERLKWDYPNINHVIAGTTRSCGQKNYNLLAGIAAAGPSVQVYAFCDSTHIAEADFLRCLIFPLATGKARFSAGYHEVIPENKGLISLSYAINVLFMRFLQGMAGLTQPWGGAMAMTSEAFEQCQVARLWADNVVDDCSLGAWLQDNKINIAYCPAALLCTSVRNYSGSVWKAWLTRQVLFLKFCFPGQWAGLCLFSCLMPVPFLWAADGIIEGLFNFGSFTSPFLALCWFFIFLGEMSIWRKFISGKPSLLRCFCAFFLSSMMLLIVSLHTVFTNTVLWNNIRYRVGKNGKVLSIHSE